LHLGRRSYHLTKADFTGFHIKNVSSLSNKRSLVDETGPPVVGPEYASKPHKVIYAGGPVRKKMHLGEKIRMKAECV